MNPTTFSELLTDISDEYIVSAANPHSKSVRWYQISAIAAGIVLLITAAVYPKLRMRTPPVIEPPVCTDTATTENAITTTVTEVVIPTETQTVMQQTNTTIVSVSATVLTTAIETETDVVTEPPQTDVLHTDVLVTTITVASTVTSTVTTQHEAVTTTVSKIDESVTTTTNKEEEHIEIPMPQTTAISVWRAEPEYLPDTSEELEITCEYHEATDEEWQRLGDPESDFDRSAYTMICATITGSCHDAGFGTGFIVDQECELLITYLKKPEQNENIKVQYLLAFPKELGIQTEHLHTKTSMFTRDESFYEGLNLVLHFIIICY